MTNRRGQSGFLLGIFGRGGKSGVLPGVGGHTRKCKMFGIPGAQRALITRSEASLQINYQIPRGGKQFSRGGNCPPLKETLLVDFFHLFVTDGMLEEVVTQTNLYAQQYLDAHDLVPKSRKQQWKSAQHDIVELKKYLALVIGMGCVGHNLALYLLSLQRHYVAQPFLPGHVLPAPERQQRVSHVVLDPFEALVPSAT